MLPIAIGISSALILKAVFSFMKMGWPNNYFDSSNRVAAWMSSKPLRILLWRSVPYVVVAALTVQISTWMDANIKLALWAYFFGHIATTNLLAFSTKKIVRNTRITSITYHTIICGSLAILTLALQANSGAIAKLMPSAKEASVGVWTAIYAAFLFAVIKFATDNRGQINPDSGSDTRFSILNLNDYYIAKTVAACFRNGTDPLLAISVLHIESTNRPKYIRQLEILCSKIIRRFGRSISIGIAQQDSITCLSSSDSTRLSDIDIASIEVLSQALRGSAFPYRGTVGGTYRIKSFSNRINKSTSYLNDVASTYEDLAMNTEILTPQDIDDHEISSGGPNISFQNVAPADSLSTSRPPDLSPPPQFPSLWGVRYEDNVYICFPAGGFSLESLKVQVIRSPLSVEIAYTMIYSTLDLEFKKGIFKIPCSGAGIRVSVKLSDFQEFRFEDIWFNSNSDIFDY